MGLNYIGVHDFLKDEVLDDVVANGDGPAFEAQTYDKITIQIVAAGITLGADILLKKSIDGGANFNTIAQIDKVTVALGDKTHEFLIFDEPLGQYKVSIANHADGTYTGTARATN